MGQRSASTIVALSLLLGSALPATAQQKTPSDASRTAAAPAQSRAASTGVEQAREYQRTQDFISGIEQAQVFDLSMTWDETSPLLGGPNPPYAMVLGATHGDTRNTFGKGKQGDDGQLSLFTENMLWSGQHGAPSIDALGHVARNGRLFGGEDAAAATSDKRGIGRGPGGVGADLGIDRYPAAKLVNRAVLLDVARFVRGDDSPLPPGFEITPSHLARTAAAEGVEIKPGDTVLIRTGWGRHFTANPELYRGEMSPGVGVDGARYLVEKHIFAAGDDTLTFEKRPEVATKPTFQLFPVHMLLIADNGIYIIENYYLEELSRARAYEFLLVTPPLKVRGASGSALRSFALVPGKQD